MENLKLKSKLLINLGSCLAGVSFMFGFNYFQNHNVVEEFQGYKEVRKIDGIMSHTELDIKDGKLYEVSRFSFFGRGIFLNDENGDGEVDRVHISPPVFSRQKMHKIYSNDDRDKYPKVFEEAQKEFDEQLVRFRDFL